MTIEWTRSIYREGTGTEGGSPNSASVTPGSQRREIQVLELSFYSFLTFTHMALILIEVDRGGIELKNLQ
jgi:hypothetical protein